ncbi:uncharacterized protein PGTG_13097 [Puccinia graminis f. sp. tritici CRL 75-36-700-3]|uniref:Uncharacterized protein n=1 Tax=Puccinia graminis f. sp. tritici (strain CRL 75-36-700-3 / race SCCL) TaxID=418459 RepID=E3KQZ0_PUCGT|nr:uncharacterized protein PGTG_13097 [Puccinia graminis f. sp. tritici CRL 75-36-700-3]EFP86715.2 hypothetical protein PGTG_13097 [Puccinia graminis f. sp. tritici CRL 75-36-700-3]
MTPKSFMLHFLHSDNSDLAYRRRYWAESAVDSTVVLVKAIRDKMNSSAPGQQAWADFIQEEAIKILAGQVPPKGNHPHGAYQSSTSVTKGYFSQEEKDKREALMTSTHMPFLYNILLAMLQQQRKHITSSEKDEDDSEDDFLTDDKDDDMPVDADVMAYAKKTSGDARLHFRYTTGAIERSPDVPKTLAKILRPSNRWDHEGTSGFHRRWCNSHPTGATR